MVDHQQYWGTTDVQLDHLPEYPKNKRLYMGGLFSRVRKAGLGVKKIIRGSEKKGTGVKKKEPPAKRGPC